MIIVDTCVWSLSFRREKIVNLTVKQQLKDLIYENRAVLLGVVRQEVLSGIKDKKQFQKVTESLRAFPNLRLEAKDYEKAAEFYNICRSKGVQGANTDFLICAAAQRRSFEVFTFDNDFQNFISHIDFKLFRQ